ncbi:hypothetical protein [Pseudomonas moraviensis]|jgi:hypothetical protein|uniref:Uncharacterized protein n=1 Tax=Pseudomonas moraviensis R28-S TaxID=1395516 RepID=V8RE59_9PSED|nr:hypothetical protein [Pseudomonas moraviensis]ETF09835.1 hypothetical protein PMO01_11175 [Pseudomonas moraviensis R28-S]
MARSVRLQQKLHSKYLIEVAGEVVLDDCLVEKLWALNRGDRFELNSRSFGFGPVQKYRLEYAITRGSIPGHWLYKEFDPKELTLFFTAKDFAGICNGWTLFDE